MGARGCGLGWKGVAALSVGEGRGGLFMGWGMGMGMGLGNGLGMGQVGDRLGMREVVDTSTRGFIQS